VHPKKENQVRHMAWCGDGVWVSIRLDTTLRLYHAKTRQLVQYLDIEPFITRMLGTSNLGLSLVRISSLMVASKRLWIGTGNGVILSIPFTDISISGKKSTALPGSIVRVGAALSSPTSKATENDLLDANVPYCNLSDAQFSFHGHRDAIKFFLNVPSEALQKSSQKANLYEKTDTVLIVSGGHGYIDFRIGDQTAATASGSSSLSSSNSNNNMSDIKTELMTSRDEKINSNQNDQARLIVWQINDQ
jgi:hypothetical protein